jgi:hypothetical protein
LPRRIFTNGRHLAQPEVFDALLAWAVSDGEIWVKLDAVRADAAEAVNGRRFDMGAHLEGIWRLARACPIGIQTMLFHGPSQPDPTETAEGVAGVVAAALLGGASIREVHVITLSRIPSDPHNATVLRAIEPEELARLGRAMEIKTGLPVHTYASR